MRTSNVELRTSNVELRTSNVEVKIASLSLLRRSTFDVRRSTFAFLLSTLFCLTFSACAPSPTPIDNSQRLNSGIDIVPEAVLAAQKIPPSKHATTGDQPDLIDVISDSDQKHYTLIGLLRDSGLVPMLQQSGPYTILAPTDEAFSKLPPGVINRLRLPSQHAQLVAFVKYHILPGRIEFTQMLQTNGQLPTLAGPNVIVKGIGDKAMVNDANVLRSDSSAGNGVVHWVDGVLILGAGV